MPSCRKCGCYFPNHIKIDNISRNLSKRKFCISCSPFYGHNTKDLTAVSLALPDTKRCPRCKHTLDIDEFYIRRDRSRPLTYCKTCVNRQTTERHRLLKERAVQYKGGCCSICGYCRCIGALEFHHNALSSKDFEIGHCKSVSLERIKPELDKCLLVCSNCHREIHAGITSYPG